MPLQNRVQPDGEILADPARGLFMGNRGILHDNDQHLTPARWRHKAWVCCVTRFKGRKRPLMTPNNYTELFFHDEAVALAAGHRPCGECRREDFRAFLDAAGHHGKVTGFDDVLHAARAIPRRFEQRRHSAEIKALPSGAFLSLDNARPALLWQGEVHPFRPEGYQPPVVRPTGQVTVLTPEPVLRALAAGYVPVVANKTF